MGFGQSAWKMEKIPIGPKKSGHFILGTGKRLGIREDAVREVLGVGYNDLECPSNAFKLYSVALRCYRIYFHVNQDVNDALRS